MARGTVAGHDLSLSLRISLFGTPPLTAVRWDRDH
jgi:hypothetical protein